jgi:hypothetical protein
VGTSSIVTRGFGNGILIGGISLVTTRGFGIGAPPSLPGELGGTYSRPFAAWNRIWKYIPMATPLLSQQTILYATTSDDRDYLFDYTAAPEIVAGLTIASANILGGTGLTIGFPSATIDVQDGIAVGKAVIVRISGGIAGKIYGLACKATLSNGRTIVIPGRLAIDPDSVPNNPLP